MSQVVTQYLASSSCERKSEKERKEMGEKEEGKEMKGRLLKGQLTRIYMQYRCVRSTYIHYDNDVDDYLVYRVQSTLPIPNSCPGKKLE